jgi:hypothetical protein
MVHGRMPSSIDQANQGVQGVHVQSIMGATENRRDGSGLVATGLEPDFAVISFNVFRTGFGVFRAISASGGCDLATGRRRVANSRGNEQCTHWRIVKPVTQAMFA